MKSLTVIATINGVDVLFDPGSVGVESSLLFKREYEVIRFTVDSDEHEISADEFLPNAHFVSQYEILGEIIDELAESVRKAEVDWIFKLKSKYRDRIGISS